MQYTTTEDAENLEITKSMWVGDQKQNYDFLLQLNVHTLSGL